LCLLDIHYTAKHCSGDKGSQDQDLSSI
jgi:hypothetical protein